MNSLRNKNKFKVIDEWEGYSSHKCLGVNIAEEYLKNRHYLPRPPSNLIPRLKEAFMTINILRDDPSYIINNVLLPMK
jgi:hypothetical protein